MNLKLARAISVLVLLFTLCLTAYACDNDAVPKSTLEPVNVDPAVIAMADRILAEQSEASVTKTGDNFRVASTSPDVVLSTASRNATVSKWLEERAVHANSEEAKTEARSGAKRSHAHYEDIEVDLGGGWCDRCGCWMHHGLDPNGTPQSEIGHPYVCTGGASTQNCWSHYYYYCINS